MQSTIRRMPNTFCRLFCVRLVFAIARPIILAALFAAFAPAGITAEIKEPPD
jgi:hypothetical protein